MRLILGIGNPGGRYRNNRHNVGFMFLDYLADKYSISFSPSQNDYYCSEHKIGESYFVLVKPSNYVNNSGISAKQALLKYDLSIDDFMVLYDDVYLPTGTFRVKLFGGDGGHNGISSIIYHLFSENFIRIRIGVGGKDFSQDQMTEYVLSDFSKDDHNLITEVFKNCSILTEAFVQGGKKQLLDTNSKLVNPINNSDKNP